MGPLFKNASGGWSGWGLTTATGMANSELLSASVLEH